MKMIYRVLIGMCAGIDNTFPSGAQDIVNIIGASIGTEIAKELKARGINENSTTQEIFDKLGEEFKIADDIRIVETDDGVEVEIKGCNVCPKKVGGYPIRKTACPVGGIVAGMLREIRGALLSITPDLIPGEKCKITIKKE